MKAVEKLEAPPPLPFGPWTLDGQSGRVVGLLVLLGLVVVQMQGWLREPSPPLTRPFPDAQVVSITARSPSLEDSRRRPRTLYAGSWRGVPWRVEFFEPFAYPIPVNHAPAAYLQALHGIGPSRAEAIIAEREQRPFTTADDLLRVHGIGPITLGRIKPFITLEP